MIIGGHGQEEGLDILLRSSQRHSLHHDGGHAHGNKRRLKRTHHLTSHCKQGIVVVIAKRRVSATHHGLLKPWRYGEVAIYLPTPHGCTCLGIIGIVSHHIKGGHRSDVAHNATRSRSVIFIHNTDGQVTHLSVAKDGSHEEQQKQRQHHRRTKIDAT